MEATKRTFTEHHRTFHALQLHLLEALNALLEHLLLGKQIMQLLVLQSLDLSADLVTKSADQLLLLLDGRGSLLHLGLGLLDLAASVDVALELEEDSGSRRDRVGRGGSRKWLVDLENGEFGEVLAGEELD